jgi:hypothetical protein
MMFLSDSCSRAAHSTAPSFGRHVLAFRTPVLLASQPVFAMQSGAPTPKYAPATIRGSVAQQLALLGHPGHVADEGMDVEQEDAGSFTGRPASAEAEAQSESSRRSIANPTRWSATALDTLKETMNSTFQHAEILSQLGDRDPVWSLLDECTPFAPIFTLSTSLQQFLAAAGEKAAVILHDRPPFPPLPPTDEAAGTPSGEGREGGTHGAEGARQDVRTYTFYCSFTLCTQVEYQIIKFISFGSVRLNTHILAC